MEMLGRYEMITELSNKDAGSCMWCFAKYGGKEYFIKEFTIPKYPTEELQANPEKREKKRKKCEEFERKKAEMYQTINVNSDGNAVRVEEMFRVGAMYYVAMPRIKAEKLSEEDVSRLPEHIRRRLCAIIAHSLAGLHAGRFVHSDIKHTNIMFTHSRTSKLTAKLIDFDAGFFEYDPPTHPEEICGDQVYFSPEALMAMEGVPIELTCKIDIFALGILFHWYYTGEIPKYDESMFESVGDAVLRGGNVEVSWDLPVELHQLFCKMLALKPEDRPAAEKVYEVLIKPLKPEIVLTEEEPIPEDQPEPVFVGDVYGRDGWFSVADLS